MKNLLLVLVSMMMSQYAYADKSVAKKPASLRPVALSCKIGEFVDSKEKFQAVKGSEFMIALKHLTHEAYIGSETLLDEATGDLLKIVATVKGSNGKYRTYLRVTQTTVADKTKKYSSTDKEQKAASAPINKTEHVVCSVVTKILKKPTSVGKPSCGKSGCVKPTKPSSGGQKPVNNNKPITNNK